jgi:hypothetical protein
VTRHAEQRAKQKRFACRLPTPAKGKRDPEKAACRILTIRQRRRAVQGHIHIEKINEPFLFRDRGSPAE